VGLARFELATSSLSVIIVLVSEYIRRYRFKKVINISLYHLLSENLRAF
jgi:hypothetical protein